MSHNYHANQFENAFKPTRLRNWEVPKYAYSSRPTTSAKNKTTPISDLNGHFLPNVPKSTKNPWGNFKSTWDIPCHLSRKKAEELCNELVTNKPIKCEYKTQNKERLNENITEDQNKNNKENIDYKPGNITESKHRYKGENIENENPHNINQPSELNELYLEKHHCKESIALLNEKEKQLQEQNPHILDENNQSQEMYKTTRGIPDKPNERRPSPLLPVYCNFQLAKKMHQENLEHQPLPDCIMDQNFQKLLSQRNPTPGLALDVVPSISAIGVKTFNAGPTHCTKMKIYRPRTCGIVPKPVSESDLLHRPKTSVPTLKDKMSSMDLAICWDYQPKNPLDEPKPPKHIDGSNGSKAPAVFTLVKTPRTPDNLDTGRSGGIFTNTLGEPDFFEKDIIQRKEPFTALINGRSKLKCSCGTSPISFRKTYSGKNKHENDNLKIAQQTLKDQQTRSKSSPNLSYFAVSEISSSMKVQDKHEKQTKEHTCSKFHEKLKQNGRKIRENLIKRITKCNKIKPQEDETFDHRYKQCHHHHHISNKTEPIKYAPSSASIDSGCSTMSSSVTSCSTTKVLHIPKPRHPYKKKSYNIKTLVPPFTSRKGGAGQGGYPEFLRLSSVYQQSYKPIEQRKQSLLKTVFK